MPGRGRAGLSVTINLSQDRVDRNYRYLSNKRLVCLAALLETSERAARARHGPPIRPGRVLSAVEPQAWPLRAMHDVGRHMLALHVLVTCQTGEAAGWQDVGGGSVVQCTCSSTCVAASKQA